MRKLAGALALMVLLSGCAAGGRVLLGHQAPATWSGEPGGYETATVTRVVDGDTAEVKVTGKVTGPGAGDTKIGHTYSVRFLGIDTPESVKPNWPVECFGHDASDATKTLLQGKSVRLVKDTEETDQYGRILRYVYLGDEMVNARLVTNGYARVCTSNMSPPGRPEPQRPGSSKHRVEPLTRSVASRPRSAGPVHE